MRARYVVIGVVIGVLLSSAVVVLAGSLDPPSGPTDAASQMYTLEQVYQRLDTGAEDAKMTSFTEPASGPGTGTMHTLDDVMGIAPAVDNTDGALPAEVLAGKTFWSLRTNSAWGLQTGTAFPAPVPRTGVTQCYTITLASETPCPAAGYPGQDGDHQTGAAWPDPRFTDNGDGTVTDNLTGLIWLKTANCTAFFSGDTRGQNQRDWGDALTAANKLAAGYCGLSDGSVAGDWRLPNVRELVSLSDFSQFFPTLPSGHPFTGVQDYCWSSTTSAQYTSHAWYVRLSQACIVYYSPKTAALSLWPVRGGQ
jgi:hypothetical protein